ADDRVSCRLGADLDAELPLKLRLLHHVMLTQFGECGHEVWGLGHFGQLPGELRPVALGDAGDQRFLRGEIDVESAGADPGLLADVLHGAAAKARAREADLRGVENVLAARVLRSWFEARHGP